MRDKIFPFIIALSAFSVSASAAFYSVFGLSKLFAGASTEVLIMAGSLEFAKLVTASLLYQYWSTINKFLKTYLTIAVMVLMVITSGGIYGYLSAAYQKTAGIADVQELTLNSLENKIDNYQQQKSSREETANSVQERITQLNEGINNIEYSWVDRDGAGDQREVLVNQLEIANEEYSRLSTDISRLDSTIFALENEKFEVRTNSEVAAELGPLIYLSELTGWEMNVVVNYFLLLIVFVFDPLAISLVLAANFAFSKPTKKINKMDNPRYTPQPPFVKKEVVEEISTLAGKEEKKLQPIKPTDEDLKKLKEALGLYNDISENSSDNQTVDGVETNNKKILSYRKRVGDDDNI